MSRVDCLVCLTRVPWTPLSLRNMSLLMSTCSSQYLALLSSSSTQMPLRRTSDTLLRAKGDRAWRYRPPPTEALVVGSPCAASRRWPHGCKGHCAAATKGVSPWPCATSPATGVLCAGRAGLDADSDVSTTSMFRKHVCLVHWF